MGRNVAIEYRCHLAIELSALHRALGEVLATERQKFHDQLERKTRAVEVKLAELTLKDAPGSCPGDDWHLLASRGSRGHRGPEGQRGLMGLRGERGEAALSIREWQIDRSRYTATPIMSDGTHGPALELRPLFEQYFAETANERS